jgi:hypothetical protein
MSTKLNAKRWPRVLVAHADLTDLLPQSEGRPTHTRTTPKQAGASAAPQRSDMKLNFKLRETGGGVHTHYTRVGARGCSSGATCRRSCTHPGFV